MGGTQWLFLNGVDSAPNTDYSQWVSHNVFCMYQLMFAIITPALIIGAIAERMKFSAILLFVTLWMFVVYFPLAHMVWGANGLMNGVWNGDAKIPAISTPRTIHFDIILALLFLLHPTGSQSVRPCARRQPLP